VPVTRYPHRNYRATSRLYIFALSSLSSLIFAPYLRREERRPETGPCACGEEAGLGILDSGRSAPVLPGAGRGNSFTYFRQLTGKKPHAPLFRLIGTAHRNLARFSAWKKGLD
jgi:hypothetical protein